MALAPRLLATADGTVPIRVRRSERTRRARVIVRPGGVAEVVLPPRAGERTADALLRRHAGWIGRQVALMTAAAEASGPARAERAGSVLLGERRLAARLRPELRASIVREDDVLVIAGQAEAVPLLLTAWYRREARALLAEAVAAHAARLGLVPRSMTVRDPRTRWGSCSSRGGLSFSWRLALVPPAVLDYVVVHELCHLREQNHGPAFWRLVARADPGYAAARAWLRAHEAGLLAYRPGELLASGLRLS